MTEVLLSEDSFVIIEGDSFESVELPYSPSEQFLVAINEVEGFTFTLADVLVDGFDSARADLWLATKDENELDGIPLALAVTYNVDGTVATTTRGSKVTTFTWTGGQLTQTSDTVYQKDFVYNVDGTLQSIAVTPL